MDWVLGRITQEEMLNISTESHPQFTVLGCICLTSMARMPELMSH